MNVLRRWEVRGPHGSSMCDREDEARKVAADRARLYPELGPFEVEEVVYHRQPRGAVGERDKLVADLRGLADRLARIGADQAAEEVGALVTGYGGQ